ncbi:MAG: hypothetical protein KJI70_02905 [Patescibacteria group bacterium]|nr:hypothetical protein [Patescibacteria group bacterium]
MKKLSFLLLISMMLVLAIPVFVGADVLCEEPDQTYAPLEHAEEGKYALTSGLFVNGEEVINGSTDKVCVWPAGSVNSVKVN